MKVRVKFKSYVEYEYDSPNEEGFYESFGSKDFNETLTEYKIKIAEALDIEKDKVGVSVEVSYNPNNVEEDEEDE